MRYTDARARMRSGDLILFRGRGVFAWLIRAVTGAPYAHAAIVWRVGPRVLLLESRARTHGVAIGRTLSGSLVDGATWIPTNAEWTSTVEDLALDARLGEPYGWVDAIRAGLGLRPTSRGVQCAEYAALVLQAAGLTVRVTAPTPGALALAFGRHEPLD